MFKKCSIAAASLLIFSGLTSCGNDNLNVEGDSDATQVVAAQQAPVETIHSFEKCETAKGGVGDENTVRRYVVKKFESNSKKFF
jgi:hypothetical protein